MHPRDFQIPSWIVGDEFDLHTLNNWMSPSDGPSGMFWPLPSYEDADVDPRNAGIPLQHSMSNAQHKVPQPERGLAVSEIWFNRVTEKSLVRGQETPTQPTSPPPLLQFSVSSAEASEVDEVYRLRLSTQMKPKWSEEPLPSTEFLVSSLS